MVHWVRIDADFGAPLANLGVTLRRLQMDKMLPPANASPEAMEEYAVRCIRHYRPNLRDFVVIGMGSGRYFDTLNFQVVHPSFHRQKMGDAPHEESLHLCPACGRPMWDGSTGRRPVYAKQEEGTGRAIEVCSEECSGDPAPAAVIGKPS